MLNNKMGVEKLAKEPKDPIGEVHREMSKKIKAELEEAKKIIEEGGNISEIKRLTPELAKSLIEKYKGFKLELPKLSILDVKTAEELAKYQGSHLYLNGLTRLDRDTAAALAKYQGISLLLNNVQKLDKYTAAALANFKGNLSLGLQELDEATAALANFRGELSLNKLEKLTEGTAAALADCKSYLYLNGVIELDEATAAALANFRGDMLSLDKVEKLTEGTAAALANYKGNKLSLGGVKDVTYEVVEKLIPIYEKLGDCRLKNLIAVVKGTKSLNNKIKSTGDKDESGVRGRIVYDFGKKVLISWGKETKVDSLESDSIRLKGLDVDFGMEEGLWLANIKNWLKKTYAGKKVEFKWDLSRNFNLGKTLVINGKTLIERGKLDERLLVTKGNDDVVRKIVEWLNDEKQGKDDFSEVADDLKSQLSGWLLTEEEKILNDYDYLNHRTWFKVFMSKFNDGALGLIDGRTSQLIGKFIATLGFSMSYLDKYNDNDGVPLNNFVEENRGDVVYLLEKVSVFFEWIYEEMDGMFEKGWKDDFKDIPDPLKIYFKKNKPFIGQFLKNLKGWSEIITSSVSDLKGGGNLKDFFSKFGGAPCGLDQLVLDFKQIFFLNVKVGE